MTLFNCVYGVFCGVCACRAKTDGIVEAEPEGTNRVYLRVSNDWKADDARSAAYVWNDAGQKEWFNLTNLYGDVYYLDIPAKYGHIKLVRMNPASTDLTWDNRWNE